jgi:hypothetical protein
VDNRGYAVTEVLLFEDGRVEVQGVLADGSKIAYKLRGDDGDRYIGRQAEDGYWVKAKTITDSSGNEAPEYLLCLGEGFKVTVYRKTEMEVKNLIFKEQ